VVVDATIYMPRLFAGQSTHIEFIGGGGNLCGAMFRHMFDPSGIAEFRLLMAVAQVGAAALILAAIAAVRRTP
jgi:hypothetical protein